MSKDEIEEMDMMLYGSKLWEKNLARQIPELL